LNLISIDIFVWVMVNVNIRKRRIPQAGRPGFSVPAGNRDRLRAPTLFDASSLPRAVTEK
jgi:hypothetical protein